MSKVKFTYFDFRARGELSRLVWAAAGKKYEEVTVQFPDWPKLKPETAYGVLPMLTVGDREYFQSNAIATYLARENGLYGSNNLECLMIDQVVQLREDLLANEAKVVFGPDDGKATITKKLDEEIRPRVFKIFTNCLKMNTTKSGFLVGKKLSLGDLAIYEGTQMCFQNNPAFLDGYPELKALRANVESGPLKKYLSERKVTPI